ncbi:methylene-tetrahydrofolate reductase-like protein [Motilibacter rhizosphaerae]|uniref:Methylene-tetrahydrofolate reductase-like protein n=1 Tax=Motilibacter rhizosphaerae TaxID=598652 RepID=A0A4Q7NGW0_9ACTN|nr:methylenetetrahydrofolate reductase C-terminal domain-containing protein [Motilibacter rhizosphaerae]RZS82686.1 methylene-tetrahydrofolate reductase-like protein [Motilibacter rhizosphaerae]
MSATTVSECPKRMVHGPCGGVAGDGTCEIGPFPCPFVGRAVVPWSGPPTPHTSEPPLLALLRQRPVVIADLPAPPLSRSGLERSADALAGAVDAVLLGDAPTARVQLPPAHRAAVVQSRGVAAWAGLTCRDRNRVALEGELAALADVGAAAVHCVTGDHTRTGDRPDAAPVFDLDSTRLAAVAAQTGLLVSVAESAAAPPREQRAERLAEKVRAGAAVCFVNLCDGPAAVGEFVAAATDAGAHVPFVACLAVAFDAGSAAALQRFPGSVRPAYGVAEAVRLAEAYLDVPGVRGVDLTAVPAPGRELETAGALAEIGRALR